MEPYYYQKMNKPQQAAYHAMQQGVLALADEIQAAADPGGRIVWRIFPTAAGSSGDLLGGELSV